MNNDRSHSKPFPAWVLIAMLVLLGPAHMALSEEGADGVTYLLQQKMDSIQIMADKIARQQQQADQLRRQLVSERETYVREIATETRRIGAAGLKQALLSPRIANNLKLVGWLDGYLKALNGRIDIYDAGTQRLKYLYAKADDDLKLVRTFTISAGEKLVADIDSALDQYHLAATAPLFDVQQIAEPDTAAVWKRLTP